MKKLYIISLILTSFISLSAIDLKLNSGNFKLDKEFDINFIDNDRYRIIYFDNIPTTNQKNELEEFGIEFLYYIPSNFYVVFIKNDLSSNLFNRYGISSINKINSLYKIDKKLKNNSFPEWCIKEGNLHIKVLLFDNVNLDNCIDIFSQLSKEIVEINESAKSLTISIEKTNLNNISSLNFVSYIEPIDPPAYPENNTGRTLHRTNIINTEYATGRNYNGEGINVMMHDDGLVEPHIDRKGRVDESYCSSCSASSNDSHGDHVSGTIMGAGNLDPLARGMADGAFLYVLGYTTNNYYQYVPGLYNTNNVVITSASYSNGCNAGYTSLARDLDEQNNIYSSLLHVFSAGNSGSSDCGYGAGSGWGNVTGGHKQAKNVIAVGNLDYGASLASSSSRGPAADGRIKPDICAQGTNVYSTYPNYTYNTISGTSMACPGISGVLAQLYQAYKELNNNNDPKSGLMKCILLNSADDIGNPGPDFKHGWGVANAYRAVKLIEDGNYFSSTISQNNTNNHMINIPSNTDEVKIMVYWHDKEGSASASTSLVNDINIQLSTSQGTIYNPWVLNDYPSSSSLDADAIRGIDNLNNMEQITITNPPAGNYNLSVDGYSIPYGPQEYFVTYEFIDNNVELTYPIGGEGLVPGEYEAIRWDASKGNSNFSLEYSVDNGSNWSTISNNIASNDRHAVWLVPNTITNQALVRISRGNSVSQSNSSFTIIDVPSNLSVYWPCPDSINVSWNSVSGASSYQINMLGSKYMDSIHTTNSTNVWIINPNPNITESWFSVLAKRNSGKGRRSVAVNASSLNNACSGYGCTDPTAYNYSPLAIVNDGSCCFVAGCTDPTAFNFDPNACFDDGSCVPPVLGCTNPNATNYDPTANTSVANGGALDNTFGGGGYFTGNQHLNFDATKECIIRSAMVYAQTAETITFELRNSAGTVLDDTTLSIPAGQQTIDLNLEVPIGFDFQLGIAASNSNLYRNNSGANYPYNIASAINITSSSATSAPYSYYYFFYNIEVEIPCQSTSAPSWDCDGQGNCYDPGTGQGQYATQSACQAACLPPVSWDCDGQGNCYDPGTGMGVYGSLSDCEVECIVPSYNVNNEIKDLRIYPNPSNDIFNIEFTNIKAQDLKIRVISIIGEEVYFSILKLNIGNYSDVINISRRSGSLYILEIESENNVIKRKLILK